LMAGAAVTTLKKVEVLNDARAMAVRVREAVGLTPAGKGGSRE